MSGTKAGAIKATQTIYRYRGKDFFSIIGTLGGSRKVKKGFAVSGLARSAGAKGGAISKRGPSVK